MLIENEIQTDAIERLLLEVIRPLYARDMQVPGLLELPLAQLRVLNVLSREGERCPPMGAVATALGVSLSTVTQLVERVEKRGLVKREHSDPDDRRIVRLMLTEAGRTLVAERRRLRHERFTALLESLTPEQSVALVTALEPLADAARQIAHSEHETEAAFQALLR